jgi:hypothetical protein
MVKDLDSMQEILGSILSFIVKQKQRPGACISSTGYATRLLIKFKDLVLANPQQATFIFQSKNLAHNFETRTRCLQHENKDQFFVATIFC